MSGGSVEPDLCASLPPVYDPKMEHSTLARIRPSLRACVALALLGLLSVSTAPAHDVVAELTRVASELVATVETSPARIPMQLSYSLEDPQRRVVDCCPAMVGAERPGLTYGLMPLDQRRATHAVLRTFLSDGGYLLVHAIRGLEDTLRTTATGVGLVRMSDAYRVQLFGTPANDSAWGFKFEGHHLSVNTTVADGQFRGTPLFLGANPAEVRAGPHAGVRVLATQQDVARDLVLSLSAAQRSTAIVGDRSDGGGLQPGPLPDVPAIRGLSASRMEPAQRVRLKTLIASFANVFRPEIARAELDRVEAAGLETLVFEWRGSTDPGMPYSYRIQGSTVLIEVDVIEDEPGAGANHVHAQWRDPQRDFGDDLIGEHLERDHADRPDDPRRP